MPSSRSSCSPHSTTGRHSASTRPKSSLASGISTELARYMLTVLTPIIYLRSVASSEGFDSSLIGLPSDIGTNTIAWVTSGALAAFCWRGLEKECTKQGVQMWSKRFRNHLLFNGLVLWEPFYCHCFLQLVFERAFGIAPAIALTAVAHGTYHIGTYPLLPTPGSGTSCVVLGCFSGVFATIFSVRRCLWTLSCSIGTLQGGFRFDSQAVVCETVVAVLGLAVVVATFYF